MKAITLATALAIGSVAAIPTPSPAASVHKEFAKAWEERDNRYAQAVTTELQASQKAVEEFVTATDPATLPDRLRSMHEAMYRARYHEGRLRFLREFRIKIADKPSPQIMELWTQEKVAELSRASEAANRQFADINSSPIDTPEKAQKYLVDMEAAIIASAHAHGAVDEFKLIDQNLSSYYQARGVEDVRKRQARAAMASALQSSFQNLSNQYLESSRQMMSRNWSARCTSFGNTTSCSGN